MSRGAEQAVQNQATADSNAAQLQYQQMLQQQQQAQQPIVAGYQQMVNSPGYTAAQQGAINNAGMQAANSAYDSLAAQAQQRAVRTGNNAGMADLTDQLARDKAQTMASQATQNQVTFANNAQKQQEAGLQGLSGLYGVDEQTLRQAMGLPATYLGTAQQAAANQKSFLDELGGAIAGGIGGTIGIGKGSFSV